MTRAEDRLYVGGWVGARKPDRGCWYERIEAGLAARAVEGESCEPRGRAAAARPSTSRPQLGDEGWAGDGYRAGQRRPHRGARTGRACRSRRQPGSEPGRTSRRRPSPIRRRRWRPRSRCPTRRVAGPRAFSPLAADDRSAGSAAGCCTSCCATCRRCRRPSARAAARRFLAQPAHGLTRRRDRALGGRGAGRHRGARPRRLVRRGLARRGAADRHGEDAARHLHRQRPGRPAGRHRHAKC